MILQEILQEIVKNWKMWQEILKSTVVYVLVSYDLKKIWLVMLAGTIYTRTPHCIP